jgi:hypothetical protein
MADKVMTGWCIATTKRASDWEQFLVEIAGFFTHVGLELKSYIIVDGPGCYNHGILVEGDKGKAEKAIENLTIQYGPIAKYSGGHDLKAGEFYMDLANV